MIAAIVALLGPAVSLPALAAPLPAHAAPLDYRASDSWKAIVAPKLSDDGVWLIYTAMPEDGDPTLIARNLRTGAEWREPRGTAGAFVGATHVAYTLAVPKSERDAARRAGRTGEAAPRGDAAILDLATGAVTVISHVERVVVPERATRWVAFRLTASPSPSATASASPAPQPASSASPGASAAPSASASPAPQLDKKKPPAGMLELRDVEAPAVAVRIPDVSDVVSDAAGGVFAYATQTASGAGDGVAVRFPASERVVEVIRGAGRYRRLTLSRDGATLAFLTDTSSYATVAPHDDAYIADLRAASVVPKQIAALGDPSLPPGWSPNANGTVAFTRDGRRLRLGAAPFVTPPPRATPAPVNVDLWSYRDAVLQSQQRHDAGTERTRTFGGVYDLANDRYVQAATPEMRDLEVSDASSVALATDPRPYVKASSWTEDELRDAYVVPLGGGPRRLVVRGADKPALSPGGRYITGWDRARRRWYAVATASGRRVTLAPAARVAFDDEEYDRPGSRPPYGIAGWLAGDRGVLLFDRYDVWLADPASGNARNLSAGAGRRASVVYSPLQTDLEATAFAADRPLLLSLFDEVHLDQGFARLPAGGGTPATLMRVPMAVGLANVQSPYDNHHHRIVAPLVARAADVAVFSLESSRNFRDLYASTTAFATRRRVTGVNPQQSRYRWADERQLFYRSARGTPLRASLYTPDGFDPKHDRRPLLVTFYERFSDTYHSYNTPAPGTSPNRIRYVSNGYVVMVADVRYRIGHPGESALECIRAATAAALRVGGIDPKRIGLAGHSWGAYQINYIITRDHRYRAVEAGAAVADMQSAYGGIRGESGVVREGQYESGQSRIGATPWDRPDLYFENSGIDHIRAIATPYLTIHNDADGAVPQWQGIEFITAMRRLGKLAYMFSFDGEEHNLVNRENQKYWTVHLDEWFDYWLRGAPRPRWFDGVDYLHRGERNVRALYGEPEL